MCANTFAMVPGPQCSSDNGWPQRRIAGIAATFGSRDCVIATCTCDYSGIPGSIVYNPEHLKFAKILARHAPLLRILERRGAGVAILICEAKGQ